MSKQYWITTLGCPKNQVDSDKLEGSLLADGLARADDVIDADVVVVNTCAFIEAARTESIETILAASGARKVGAKLVVTGCMAERYGAELADAIPEVDQVAGFGVPIKLGLKPKELERELPKLDLLNMARPASSRPWAYVKIAEGCNRTCGFCAIPSFRGPQQSRTVEAILGEVAALDAKEIVLVAQDLASYGKDRSDLGAGSIVALVREVAKLIPRTRLLYLYPSDLTDELIDVIGAETEIAYYDLSLQHVSKPLLRRMRRWGDGSRFLKRIGDIRGRYPDAAFRTNFIVGYPGETEQDHDELLRFVEESELDWAGFFTYSREEGTHAASLDGEVDGSLMRDRHAELTDLQDRISAGKRADLVGTTTTVLVDEIGVGRSHREAPEIDGIIHVPKSFAPGSIVQLQITDVDGLDLIAETCNDVRNGL